MTILKLSDINKSKNIIEKQSAYFNENDIKLENIYATQEDTFHNDNSNYYIEISIEDGQEIFFLTEAYTCMSLKIEKDLYIYLLGYTIYKNNK